MISQISIRRIIQNQNLRKVENVHIGIDYCYVFLFHDLIITAGVNVVDLWNSELTKPVSTIRKEAVSKGAYILDGYRILIIGCKTNTYFLQCENYKDIYFYQQIRYIPESCCAFIDKNGIILLGSRNIQFQNQNQIEIKLKKYNFIHLDKIEKFIIQESIIIKLLDLILIQLMNLKQNNILRLIKKNITYRFYFIRS